MKRDERDAILEQIKKTNQELSNAYHMISEFEECEEIANEIWQLQDKLDVIDWKFPSLDEDEY